ncbi:hypothetical protein EVAR_35438_1 [Eumeta japonica]|uniref:Uncharacterized protein n=1 Tax=Eumeta variegata TaxID=151549 RepID=A0A4C1XAX0_EUMVA|nr:hypothetical protein EVAR_35438_1 [Eumeta japonica]
MPINIAVPREALETNRPTEQCDGRYDTVRYDTVDTTVNTVIYFDECSSRFALRPSRILNFTPDAIESKANLVFRAIAREGDVKCPNYVSAFPHGRNLEIR